ncbi:hypothetical protein [Streptomyces violaceusniger]|uniref:hypothetical protein n=1 Tax=Streptomyces violaceusniger TaxID=68280 RepID=UPI0031D2869D
MSTTASHPTVIKNPGKDVRREHVVPASDGPVQTPENQTPENQTPENQTPENQTPEKAGHPGK